MIDIPQTECSICKGSMPLLRKTKFGYNFCVNCSNVAPKQGITVTRGPGEDTYEQLILVSSEDYKNINKHNEPSLDATSFEEDDVEC